MRRPETISSGRTASCSCGWREKFDTDHHAINAVLTHSCRYQLDDIPVTGFFPRPAGSGEQS